MKDRVRRKQDAIMLFEATRRLQSRPARGMVSSRGAAPPGGGVGGGGMTLVVLRRVLIVAARVAGGIPARLPAVALICTQHDNPYSTLLHCCYLCGCKHL